MASVSNKLVLVVLSLLAISVTVTFSQTIEINEENWETHLAKDEWMVEL